jgi:hypothetical protein
VLGRISPPREDVQSQTSSKAPRKRRSRATTGTFSASSHQRPRSRAKSVQQIRRVRAILDENSMRPPSGETSPKWIHPVRAIGPCCRETAGTLAHQPQHVQAFESSTSQPRRRRWTPYPSARGPGRGAAGNAKRLRPSPRQETAGPGNGRPFEPQRYPCPTQSRVSITSMLRATRQ